MKLRSVTEISKNSTCLLRMDLDLPSKDGVLIDNSRLVKSVPTIKFLLENDCKIIVIGHWGRPNGAEEKYSLKPIYLELMSLLEPNGENAIESIFANNEKDTMEGIEKNQIVVMENLRFWPEEEANDLVFLSKLKTVCNAYINDAFTVAHRKHRSIMIHQEMETYYGLSFIDEVEKISKLIEVPQHPLTIILGGAKEDKLSYLPELTKIADYVLIGGKLPLLVESRKSKVESLDVESQKVVVASLREDTLDLSENDIDNFVRIISDSKMVVWSGAMGKYEERSCQKGTEEIARAVASVSGLKIIAGGDTSASILSLGLKDKIDLICSGGGVMLEYLTRGTLPAWE